MTEVERRTRRACPAAAAEWLRRLDAEDGTAIARYALLQERASAEDGAAQELLFVLHADEAVGWARQKLGSAEDARDAAQNGFVLALAALPGTRVRNFRSWLRTIVTRQAISIIRKRLRDRSLRRVAAGGDAPAADAASIQGELCAQVWDAVRQMPRRERAVLAMLAADETYGDIAKRLGLTVGVVCGLIRRLRHELSESPLIEWIDEDADVERRRLGGR